MKQYIIILILLVSGALTATPALAQKTGTKHTVTGKVTDQSGEPLGNPRYVPVRQVYRLEPCDQLALPDQKRIMGVQCNLWTEYIGDIGHAQHMVLPRMAALSEIGWACDRKDYNDFVRRVPALVRIYEAEGYRYAPYLFEGIE